MADSHVCSAAKPRARLPKWVIHVAFWRSGRRSALPRKRAWLGYSSMSAKCQLPTSRHTMRTEALCQHRQQAVGINRLRLHPLFFGQRPRPRRLHGRTRQRRADPSLRLRPGNSASLLRTFATQSARFRPVRRTSRTWFERSACSGLNAPADPAAAGNSPPMDLIGSRRERPALAHRCPRCGMACGCPR